MKAKLIVVGGDAKAAEVKLKLPTVIGRGREANLTLPHPLVSRKHCEIFEDKGKLCVRDLGSLNGTYVNNERITDATSLPSGDLLTVGAVTFRAVYGDPAASGLAGPAPGQGTVRSASSETVDGAEQATEQAAPATEPEFVEQVDDAVEVDQEDEGFEFDEQDDELETVPDPDSLDVEEVASDEVEEVQHQADADATETPPPARFATQQAPPMRKSAASAPAQPVPAREQSSGGEEDVGIEEVEEIEEVGSEDVEDAVAEEPSVDQPPKAKQPAPSNPPDDLSPEETIDFRPPTSGKESSDQGPDTGDDALNEFFKGLR
jgi:predicted component of type VI protein secretion system